ncbi:MAG: hypothetical protein P1V36_07470 [Planctomycetota bacterium]|nr:hypothetical protein [Planctomycetota bacterium]
MNARTGILFLLLLGLATYAGVQAGVRAPVRRPAPDRGPIARAGAEDPPLRLLSPWEEYDEGLWVPPADEEFASPPARPAPPPRRAKPRPPTEVSRLRPGPGADEPLGEPWGQPFGPRRGRRRAADGSGLW